MAEKPKAEKKERASKQEEKVLVIPLRHQSRKSAKNMRKNRSVREIRAFLARHMRTEPSKVSISQQLNESLWKGGLHNTPAKIKVKVSMDEEGKVLARMLDEREKPKSQKKGGGLRERLTRKREGAKEEKKVEKPAAPEEPAQVTPGQ
jgi:large subunit ribosomal protein L31e